MSLRTRLADKLFSPKFRIATSLHDLVEYTNRGITRQVYVRVGPVKRVSAEILGTDSDVYTGTFTMNRQTVFDAASGLNIMVPDNIYGVETGDVIRLDNANWTITDSSADDKRSEWEITAVRTHPRRLK